MNLELVSTKTEDGVRLDGALMRAPSRGAGDIPVDLFICHHGVACNFYDPRLYGPLGELLIAAGCDVLTVNNRGHDVVYNQFGSGSPALRRTRGKLGAAFELMDDCRFDWKAWIDFAQGAGYRRIGLWSHSLGAVKNLYFLANGSDPRVRCAVASSPPRFRHASYLASPAGAAFSAAHERAKALLGAGDPHSLFSTTVPTPSVFTAQTFLDKYGLEDRFDYFPMLPKIRTPLLVTLGGDERETAFIELNEQGDALVKPVPGAGFARIEGADHFYTGHCDGLWAAAKSWLAGIHVKD